MKHCRRVIEVDGGVEIVLERYAEREGDRFTVEPVEVRVRADEALSLEDVRTLADTLHRITEAVAEAAAA